MHTLRLEAAPAQCHINARVRMHSQYTSACTATANVVGHAPLSRVASIVEAVDPVPLLVGASAAFGATYLDGVAALRCE